MFAITTGHAPASGRAGDIGSMPACVPVFRGDEIVAFALVDRDLATDVAAHRWNLDDAGYAYTNGGAGRISLHRYVVGLRAGEPFIAHHANGEKLDCRRANLKVLTTDQHLAAHGMRRRGRDAAERLHPAIDRGLRRWLEQSRRTDPLGASELMNGRGGAPKKLPKTITRDEAERLLKMPNLKAPTGMRDRCILQLMYRCGLRVGEVCELHLRDVRWQESQIRLRGEITKGGKEAVAYLDESTQALLEQWVAVRRRYAAGKPYLFTTLAGGQVSRHAIWEMIGRRARKAKIEQHVSPHMLRHSFATELLREGFNLREVQQLLRHSDIRTTVIYTHVYDAELAAKIRDRPT